VVGAGDPRADDYEAQRVSFVLYIEFFSRYIMYLGDEHLYIGRVME